MTKQELIEILEQVSQGRKIPGVVAKKEYTFKGFAEYTGKGRYRHLRGTRVIVLQSDERKIPNIALFLEPLLLLVNSDPSKLRFGKLPPEYIDRYHSGDTRGMPNLYDCEGHYKALARYIQKIIIRNNENPRLGSKHETIGDQREPTHWEFFGEGPGTTFLQKKGVPGAFT